MIPEGRGAPPSTDKSSPTAETPALTGRDADAELIAAPVATSLDAILVDAATDDLSPTPPAPQIDIWPWVRSTMSIRTILDIGANVGDFGEFLYGYFQPSAMYVFEPLPSCQPLLQEMAARHANITVFDVALSDYEGEQTFWENEYGPSSSLLHVSDTHKRAFPETRNESQAIVRVARLDDVLAGITLEDGILVKIDVQGVEDRVILGGLSVFSRAAVVVVEMSFVEMYDGQPLFEEIHDLLVGCGLRLIGMKNQIVDSETGQPLFAHCYYGRTARRDG